ncbi:hypothetical protein [Aquitalea sp. LB_tupeE]|uniref:hypothetical protein n=1 Tax=Aquitalea sp. LB_tupeE TaxID=2748078 RepID=UPI0015BC61AC|nr:hypothetical protein [Aquitalea sp. LB_tupeE]NWK80089.1 hypothetical protein [Aquitalea sp. LB_tupeE]
MRTQKISSLAIQFTILFNLSTPSPAKTTIILSTEPNIKVQSVTVQNENIQEMEIIYKEKTCRIKFPYWIGHTSASISSDSEFLILDRNGFIKISDLENCDKNDVDFKEITNSFQSARLMNVNSARNLILLYINPIFGMMYEKKSKYSHMAVVIINKAINGYGTLPDPLEIKHRQFFSPDRNSNVDLDHSLFAGHDDKAFFSPDGKYLALKSSAISCKKGAYPGVFETTHWKQVIFNRRDSNKKCRALFPQLK